MKTAEQTSKPSISEARPFFHGKGLLLLLSLWIGMFIAAMLTPPNYRGNEVRIGAYMLDAIQNGHWVAQRDATGEYMAKPPLYTWVALLFARVTGVNNFSLHVPSALSTLASLLLLYHMGKTVWGERAGFLAGLTYLVSYASESEFLLARYDALLGVPVLWGVWGLYRGWISGKGWMQFWGAAAISMMIKGPIGPILSSFGFVVPALEKHRGGLKGSLWKHLAGITLVVGISGLWLFFAWRQEGSGLLQKLFVRELISHATGQRDPDGPDIEDNPFLAFIFRFLPWCIFSVIAAVLAFVKPNQDPQVRRFEKILSVSLVAGLIFFSLTSHQRSRLISPLIPMAALLAGIQLERFIVRFRMDWLKIQKAIAILMIVFLAGEFVYHTALKRRSRSIISTQQMKALAHQLEKQGGKDLPLTYLRDVPFGLQIYLGHLHRFVSSTNAAQLIQSGYPIYLVTCDTNSLAEKNFHLLASAPQIKGNPIFVMSNAVDFQPPDRIGFMDGTMEFLGDQVRFQGITRGTYQFRATSTDYKIQVKNLSTVRAEKFKIAVEGTGGRVEKEVSLESGQQTSFGKN